MSKRPQKNRSSSSRPATGAPASPRYTPPARDPIRRLYFFSEIMALGLVAAAILLKFPNSLNRPGAPAVPLDYFPGFFQNAAFLAVHTRAIWITLAVLGTIAAAMGRYARSNSRDGRWLLLALFAMLLVILLQVAAQAWLQSQGSLVIELRGDAPAAVGNAVQSVATRLSTTGSTPAIRVESVTRFVVREGTGPQWELLFAGDFLFCVPALLAWGLSSIRRRTLPSS